MRVFLTGASGFIGSHVARALVMAGHDVGILAVANDDLWRLQDVVGRLSVWRGDLAEMPALRPTLGAWQPEVCIHLAWHAEPGKYLHSPENLKSLAASLILLQELAQMGCRQVVAAGTCAEYDTDRGYLREDGPIHPTTLYATAKLAFGLLGKQMAAAAGMQFAWARIFYLYGPGEDRRRVIPALICSLLGGQSFPATQGEQVRDYVHVEDVSAAFLTLVDRHADGVFNIASGAPVTIRQLLETVGELVGRTQLIQFGALSCRDWEPKFICGDNQRLCGLGWSPRYALRDGLRQTLDWWQSHLQSFNGTANLWKNV
jgi:nucleoside-diphosphate-sugar epimerase